MQFHFALDVEDDVSGFSDVVDVRAFVSREGVGAGELDLRVVINILEEGGRKGCGQGRDSPASGSI